MTIPNDFILYINIFIILLYILMIFIGYKKGFIFGIISIIYNIFAVLVAWLVSPVLADTFPFINADKLMDSGNVIVKLVDIGPIVNTAFYFVCIFVVLRVLYLFVSLFAKSVNDIPLFGSLNKVVGGVIGFINATIIVTVLSLLLALPVFSNGKQIKDKTIFRYIEQCTNTAVDYGMNHIDLTKFKNTFADFDSNELREQLKQWINEHTNE